MAAADARAHAFDELCPCTACDRSCVEMAPFLGVGLRAAIGGLPRPRGPGGRLVKRTRRGAGVCSRRPSHKLVERVAPSAPTSLLRVTDTSRTVVIYNNETLNAASLDRARHNKCFTHLCFVATAIRRPRSARINTSSSASFTQ